MGYIFLLLWSLIESKWDGCGCECGCGCFLFILEMGEMCKVRVGF